MTREEETRQNIKKYHDDCLCSTLECRILGEIAISLAIIVDALKKEKENRNENIGTNRIT